MTELLNMLRSLDVVAYGIIGAILIVFAVCIISAVKVKAGYGILRMKLKNKDYRRDARFQSEFINSVVDEYTVAVSTNGSDINTSAIVDKCIQRDLKGLLSGERFIKSSVSTMIILGLLGTFLGLTQSVSSLSTFFQNGEDVNSVLQSAGNGIMDAISGMGTAFSTSLVGVFCSIIITLTGLGSVAEESRIAMITDLEDYLDNTLYSIVADEYSTKDTKIYVAVSRALDEFLDKLKPISRPKVPGNLMEAVSEKSVQHTGFTVKQERRQPSEEDNKTTVIS
ncbi:MAG: MotA/TolQ/ExbB proton channel family protein [Clostridia bacterium]|nr:MotA/TolQ/ExbB proton channel family protein [Clostridia bacterium]